MPRFEPFQGLRYNSSVPLDQVVAPPYDVVSPVERATLAARSPINSIHVELPVDDPRTGQDRYESAAGLLRSWIEQGILISDQSPCLYAYRMTEPDGNATSGVVGALGCEPHGGDVLPHELTIPKDMSDRLQLLRACRANLSPIWGLSLTEGLASSYSPKSEAPVRAFDDAGVLHELWVIDDPSSIESVVLAVSKSPVVIADGHHRYETAIAYQRERRTIKADATGDHDFVMALIVELSEDQLSVGAIHRMVHGLPHGARLLELVGRWFDAERLGDADETAVESVTSRPQLALVTGEGLWKLTPTDRAIEQAESDLDSSFVMPILEAVPGAKVAYSHRGADVLSAVRTGEADAGFLLRPVTVPQISEWAHARRLMPPKSTYFHPKPRTGMVFRPITD